MERMSNGIGGSKERPVISSLAVKHWTIPLTASHTKAAWLLTPIPPVPIKTQGGFFEMTVGKEPASSGNLSGDPA